MVHRPGKGSPLPPAHPQDGAIGTMQTVAQPSSQNVPHQHQAPLGGLDRTQNGSPSPLADPTVVPGVPLSLVPPAPHPIHAGRASKYTTL